MHAVLDHEPDGADTQQDQAFKQGLGQTRPVGEGREGEGEGGGREGEGEGEGERERGRRREREHGGGGGYVACAEVQLCLLEHACTVPRCLLAHHHRSQLTVISN